MLDIMEMVICTKPVHPGDIYDYVSRKKDILMKVSSCK